MIIFNSNITRVSVYPKYRIKNGRYRIERNYKNKIGQKFLIFPVYEIIKAAVIYRGWSSDILVSKLEDFVSDEFYFEDDLIYEKPNCVIFMNDKSSHTKYFETVDELNAYIDELKKNASHIII